VEGLRIEKTTMSPPASVAVVSPASMNASVRLYLSYCSCGVRVD
jgi:hypothetical protein